ncbi:MarR family transcriptional regulator [Rhodococcus antarcticus]|uniref:MarR family transcriptional regulator n=1 Tax=Rhodococcus antarcticus TaxID=2987751 RepID=A0ABY6P3S0_9NOCA|nr:MarR family transcriptional regulator [Rhodococcus antarcticus]UZJ26297.1 MarR family transcriptional regulator [Rhodococcus antarcticus]
MVAEDVQDWPTGRLLSAAARVVEHSWEGLLREHGLTHAGLIALHCLGSGPSPQRALAQLCRVTDQTMSRTVGKLVRGGFVERSADPTDERKVVVTITGAGRGVHERMVAAERSDAVLTSAVSDPAALRAALVEILTRA